MWIFGVAPRARILLHEICQQQWFWIPRMGVSEIAQFKHPHTRHPKTFFSDLVQRYARLEYHAKKPHVLALRISNTPILGTQKSPFWPMVCRGTGVWGTTPEPKQFFLALCSSNTPILSIKTNLLLAYGVQWYGCLECHPITQTIFFWHRPFQTLPS